MHTGKIHFFIEKVNDEFVAIRCFDLGSDKPNVKDEYKKFVKAGYLPYTGEDELIIKKSTKEELEEYLVSNYPNYRCAYSN